MKNCLLKCISLVSLLLFLVLSYSNISNAASIGFEINDAEKKTVTITDYEGDLTGIRIPETVSNNGVVYTVTAIDDEVFQYDSNLTLVEIPASIVSIGKNCFYKCDNLVQVRIEGTGIRTIGDYAFYQCENLRSVTFGGDGLLSIGERAFFECALTSFTIPSTVTTLGEAAFGYAQFSSIEIPGSVTSYGEGMFFNSDTLKKITFGEGITTLWSDALGGCESITSVTLPSTLKTIKKEAFLGEIKLNELVIPKGVTSIQADAFDDMTVNTLRANCPNAVLDERSFVGLYVKTIYCYYNSAFYKHYIEDEEVKVILIDNPMVITNPSITMGVGSRETVQLIGTGNIVWKSSNKKIATVNSKGVVTARKKGKVTITATCDGKSATCKIKVKANERKLKSYSKKISKYGKNKVFFQYSKVKIDSKGNCIVTGHLFNTTKKTYKKATVQLGVYRNSSRIASQSVSVKVKSKPKSVKKVTLKIKKKYVKKYTNLCNGEVYVRDNGMVICK